MPYKDPEKLREYQREYQREWKRRRRAANPEKFSEQKRAADLKLHYGLTLGGYAFLSVSQNAVCAVCHQPCKTGMRLAVDHCHQTNLVRGLLCRECNTSAGKLGEDPDRIERLAAYIRAFHTKAANMIGFQINPLPADHADHMELQQRNSK
jgi:Recombination endonuclease VII